MSNNGAITKTEYSNIHHFLQYQYGLAQKCEECGLVGSRNSKRWRIEWALKHGRKYSRNIKDYRQLCSSCHRYYDYTKEQKKLLSIRKIGNKNAAKPVVQIKNGIEVKVFESLSEAERETGILHTSICNVLAGRTKTAGKYYWKRIQKGDEQIV